MPRYIYKAKKGPQELLEGTVDAETYNEAINKLAKQGYFPVSLQEEKEASLAAEKSTPFKRRKIRRLDISTFTRQISELLGSGVPLLQGLEVLSQQSTNKSFKLVIDDLSKTIQEGSTFSDALAKYPKLFSNLYVSITRSGELGGKLEYALGRLAGFMEKEDEMVSRVQQALAYPALMCTVGALTIIILMTVVVPRLVTMFTDIGQALPLPTQILIGISTFLTKYWWLVLFALIFAVYSVKRRLKSTEGRLALDAYLLKLPVVGPLINILEIARVSRTLATLLDSGIAILPALDSVVTTVQNQVIRAELVEGRDQVREGVSLGKSLKDAKNIPPYVVNMISVGEESGKLESVLFRVAASYELQADKAIRIFMTLLEPILILVMGFIVGFIVISMLLPIFQFNIMIR